MQEMSDKEEEMKKEDLIEANQTPSTVVRRSHRVQSFMGTRTSATATGTATKTGTTATGSVIRTSDTPAGRLTSVAGTRITKVQKEEAPTEMMATTTPAPQRGRKKALEMPAQVVPTPTTRCRQKKGSTYQTPAPVARSSVRPTRQSTRRITESMKGSRGTRTMADMMSLDVDGDKKVQAVVEKVEEKEEQTTVELQDVLDSNTLLEINLDAEEKEIIVSDVTLEEKQEAMKAKDVIELGEATQPGSADIVEVEEQTYQNEADEVSEESEPAKEDDHLAKEDELVLDEIFNLTEHNVEQIECTEENIDVGLDINTVISTEQAENDVEEKSNSNVSFVTDSEISAEEVEEQVNVVEYDPIVAPISDEVQVAPIIGESNINRATQVDSSIMGLVSEVGLENNSEIQDAPLSGITVDAQVAPSDLCFSSLVRAPADIGMEKMADSVVRRFAKASIKDSAKKTDACCVVQKEEAVKIVSDDAPGMAQNENATLKEKVNLNGMSLRKLKAFYKDRLIEVNSKKLVEEGKSLPLAEEEKWLPLGKLDDNIVI